VTFEYQHFLLEAVPYLPEARRAAMHLWLNGLGREGWEVFLISPMRENEAGLIAWAKRRIAE
jgi:hypothetical protein